MEEKSCKNCKYFVQYYIKHKRYLIKAECGHCVKRKSLNENPKEYEELRKQCNFWEPQSVKSDERRKSIKEVLRDMERSLEAIKIILQSDKE